MNKDLPLVPVVDAHCDSLMGAVEGINLLESQPAGHLDLPRLLAGGVACQFMALFISDEHLGEAKARTHRMIDAFGEICAASDGRFFPILSAKDLGKAKPGESVGGLLSIEGAEALEAPWKPWTSSTPGGSEPWESPGTGALPSPGGLRPKARTASAPWGFPWWKGWRPWG